MIKLDFNKFLKSRNYGDDGYYLRHTENFPFREGVWLAGGFLRDLFLKKPYFRDIDVFFDGEDSRDNFDKFLKKNYLSCRNHLTDTSTAKTYRIESKNPSEFLYHLTDTSTAKTYRIESKNPSEFLYWDVQLVHIHWFDSVEDIFSKFNFTINQIAFDGKYIYFGESTLFDLAEKRLRVVNNNYRPKSTALSLQKYINYGFKIPSNEIAVLLKAAENDDSEAWSS